MVLWYMLHVANCELSALRNFIKEFLHKLTLAKWKVNIKKSVIIPAKSVVIVGATWSQNFIHRNKDITDYLKVMFRLFENIKLK